MACPFGYGGGEADDEEEELEQLEELEEKRNTGDQRQKQPSGKPTSKAQQDKKKNDDRFDFDKDPVSWFYQNQIKSEEDFQAKKAMLREEAKKRLEALMRSKNKMIDWGSDSEWDDLSIRSSELSELDSDVDSLASIMSCAESWIVDADYKTPAENFLKYSSMAALAVAAHSMYHAFIAMVDTRKVQGVVLGVWWPTAAFFTILLAATFMVVALAAAMKRNKKALLASQCGNLVAYAASVALVLAMVFNPTMVDPKLKESACARYSASDGGSRLCHMLPGVEATLTDAMAMLTKSCAVMAVSTVLLAAAGCWYTYELAYVEKKAIKHKRRHKRRKHSIPWEKIKIVGPVTNCGMPAAGAKVAAGGGGCPMGMGGGAAAKKAA